ncbi:MAG TPA: Tad domain-containing protein [Gaiellaceae bacterium]|nr:Tad domain-containing protein [Gaiellaceae bacterium]
MSGLRRSSGQATVLSVLFLTVLMGMVAAVLDVGAWFRADRALQTTVDAAALAGAQELSTGTAPAGSRALEYSAKNGGGISAANISFETKFRPNDTIVVQGTRSASGVFSKLFGINSVDVHGKSKARAATISSAKYVAPIAVDIKHPLLQCKPQPCFEEATTLDLQKVGPGAFRLLNLDDTKGGTGPSTLADWILNGYQGYLPLDWYFSDPGAKFNSSQVKSAMNARLGSELLFPIYDLITGSGANLEYHVIGWVGFVVTSFAANGNTGTVDGYFKRVIWDGIESTDVDETPDLGVRKVTLVE